LLPLASSSIIFIPFSAGVYASHIHNIVDKLALYTDMVHRIRDTVNIIFSFIYNMLHEHGQNS